MVIFFGTETSTSSGVSSPTVIRKLVDLTGAVRADESALLTRVELERGIDEKHLTAVLFAHTRERNHTSTSPWPTSTASPPTRTRVIARRSPSIEMWIRLARPIAAP